MDELLLHIYIPFALGKYVYSTSFTQKTYISWFTESITMDGLDGRIVLVYLYVMGKISYTHDDELSGSGNENDIKLIKQLVLS